jgi:hypothetical protein
VSYMSFLPYKQFWGPKLTLEYKQR